MDVCLVIKRRLEELGLEQKDLATAAEVTESYISQLLARKKLPPAPDRTDIYAKMAKFLKLPSDRLSKLAEHQRREELERDLVGPPAPLFREVREVILRKCVPDKEKQVRAIFEKQPFGTPRHTKAFGRDQGGRQRRIEQRKLAPLGGSTHRPKLRTNAGYPP